mgnify:CR=1 FL=1
MTQNQSLEWHNPEQTNAHKYLIPKILSILSKHHQPAHRNILDAGCGNGAIANILQRNGYKITAIDSSESGIDHAQRAYPNVHFRNISIYENLSETLKQKFDIIVSTEVVEHLTDPQLYAENLFNALDDNGLLIVSTPYHGYLKNLTISIFNKWDNHFTVLWDGGHIKFWSYKTLKKLLSNAGFASFSFYGAGRLHFLWKSMIIVAQKSHPSETS